MSVDDRDYLRGFSTEFLHKIRSNVDRSVTELTEYRNDLDAVIKEKEESGDESGKAPRVGERE